MTSQISECSTSSTAKGLLFVFSGPSGVGKDAVIDKLKQQRVPLSIGVTVTTRPKRPGEIEGVHYYFVSTEQFETMQSSGELLEWAHVHGNFYGTPRKQISEALDAGRDVLLKIDVQGAAQIKQRVPDAVFIFLAPPNHEQLVERLCGRGTETPESLRRRIENSREEMARLPEYDYVVVNCEGQLDETVEQVKAVICAEKLRVHRRRIVL